MGDLLVERLLELSEVFLGFLIASLASILLIDRKGRHSFQGTHIEYGVPSASYMLWPLLARFCCHDDLPFAPARRQTRSGQIRCQEPVVRFLTLNQQTLQPIPKPVGTARPRGRSCAWRT